MCTYFFWSSDSLSHPYSHALTLEPSSHVTFPALYRSSCYPVITLQLISFLHSHINSMIITHHLSHLICSTRYHNTSQLISQFTHHHINTITTSHSPADDGRNNSSESSCYIYFFFITCVPSCINLSNNDFLSI